MKYFLCERHKTFYLAMVLLPDNIKVDDTISHRAICILCSYYLDGTTATVKEFMAPNIMDKLKLQMEYARNITWENCRVHKPIRFTETSSAFGGGANGISNAYVAGFL